MGIVATQPAFKRFTIKPQPGSVQEAQITLPTQVCARVGGWGSHLAGWLVPAVSLVAKRISQPRFRKQPLWRVILHLRIPGTIPGGPPEYPDPLRGVFF